MEFTAIGSSFGSEISLSGSTSLINAKFGVVAADLIVHAERERRIDHSGSFIKKAVRSSSITHGHGQQPGDRSRDRTGEGIGKRVDSVSKGHGDILAWVFKMSRRVPQ